MPNIECHSISFLQYHYFFLAPYLFAQPYRISSPSTLSARLPYQGNVHGTSRKIKRKESSNTLHGNSKHLEPQANHVPTSPFPCHCANKRPPHIGTQLHPIQKHTSISAYQHTRICNQSQHPRLDLPNGWFSCKPSDPAPSPRPRLKEPTAQSPSK